MPQLPNEKIITLAIKRLGINGEGIGYFQNIVVFVEGALPKERVQAQIIESKPRYAVARLIKIIKASSERAAPRCPVYDVCGGCQLQHLDYPAQVRYKDDLLQQALKKYQPKGYQNYRILPAIAAEDPWFYRNKAQFQLAELAQQPILGLYARHSHDVVPIETCFVQEPETNEVLQTIRALLEKYHAPIYEEKTNSGIFKRVIVRTSLHYSEVQVVFVTNSKKFPAKKAILAALQDAHPEVVSILQNYQPEKTSLIFGKETTLLAGKETIQDKIGTTIFEFSARAFLQLNPAQTLRLYERIRELAAPQPDDLLIDAYCGVGTIGLFIAPFVKKVIGMDTIKEGIADANQNAANNQIDNAAFFVGAAETLLPEWSQEGSTLDILIVDPPRVGLAPELLQSLLAFPPKRLIYVSCNVSTLAKDLAILTKKYHVDVLQSIDMFPQTARTEAIVKLSLPE